MPRSTSTSWPARGSTSTAPSPGSTPCSRPTDGAAQVSPARTARARRALPARLAGGALRPHRRRALLPLPEGPGRHQLVAPARLGDAYRVPRPARDRRDPGDVLQAEPRAGARVGAAHHRRHLGRLARPRDAPLGCERLHHPDVHAHGARLPVRRVQVPPRAELDRRRAPARDGPLRGPHRVPPALRPDRLLGDGRGDQHQRDGAVRRAVPRVVVTRWRRDRARRALPLLFAPHAARAGRADGSHRTASLPRGATRRLVAAVVGGGGGRPGSGRADAGALGPGAAAAPDDSREADGMTSLDDRRSGFQQYKDDVKSRGKPFYPYAMFHDTVMSLVVVLVIVGCAVVWHYTDILGAQLGDKADPGTRTFVPRPDWYFYFLFYLLRIFKWPETVILATVGIPTICLMLLLALPFIDL